MTISRPAASKFFLGLALVVALALCVGVYAPGLHGDFIFDDGPNITANKRLQVHSVSVESLRQAAFSADSGMLKRPLSMLSFWANYYTTGLDPYYFKLTNLIIHLVNGLGLFWLTCLLLDALRQRDGSDPLNVSDRWMAVAVAAIWLLHPLNLTSVLYVVQRMTSLSATFVILGLLCYLLGRRKLAQGDKGLPLMLLGIVGFGLMATLTKENGALILLYVLVLETTLLRFGGIQREGSNKLKLFLLLAVVLPVLAAASYVLFLTDWLSGGYQDRGFTLQERLMTQTRVLWLYLRWTFIPVRSELGLFHDDIATSRSIVDPATTLLAVVGIIALLGTAVRFRKHAPLYTFAVCWYFAGHSLESSFIALEMVHEHRNYLPIFGPLLGACYGLFALARRAMAPRAAIAVSAAFVLALAAVTFARASDWRDLHTLRMAHVRDHPDSARANHDAGVALWELSLQNPARQQEYYDHIKAYFERAASLDKNYVHPFFGLILLNATHARPVDEQGIDRLAARLSEAPLRPTIVEPFTALVDWIVKGTVVLPRDAVERLFGAALGNENVDTRTKSALLSVASAYYYNVLGDRQSAVSLAVAAVEAYPAEPAHHVSLADLAIKLGNFELAARELAAAGRHDPLGRFTLRLCELARELPPAYRPTVL